MAKRKNREFWESSSLNNMSAIQYYNRLTELSISMFEWKNLPDTIDPRFLELTLFAQGQIVFFKDSLLGYLALPNAGSGQLNVYRIPTRRRAYASNGYSKDLDDKDSVIIWNNLLHTSSRLDVQLFANRLYELDRIIDVNVRAQKTPVLIRVNDSQRLTLQNVYMKYDGNQPVIFATKDFDPDSISVLKTEAPYNADKIYQLKTQYWNEALTYLGISNTNVTKKERMISDEVMRNMGGVIASRYSRLEARRQACEEINKMFGLQMEVDYREDYREIDDEIMISDETGDENLHLLATDLRTNTPLDEVKGGRKKNE